jgi:hypothetical protein
MLDRLNNAAWNKCGKICREDVKDICGLYFASGINPFRDQESSANAGAGTGAIILSFVLAFFSKTRRAGYLGLATSAVSAFVQVALVSSERTLDRELSGHYTPVLLY